MTPSEHDDHRNPRVTLPDLTLDVKKTFEHIKETASDELTTTFEDEVVLTEWKTEDRDTKCRG